MQGNHVARSKLVGQTESVDSASSMLDLLGSEHKT
jgi:hypothetical protein